MKYVLLVLLGLGILFCSLSYHFYGELKTAEQALLSAQAVNKSLEESLSKREEECKIDISTSSVFWQGKVENDKKTNSDINILNSLPSKSVANKATNVVKKETEDEGISLDSKLPDDFRVLLEQACERNSLQACPSP